MVMAMLFLFASCGDKDTTVTTTTEPVTEPTTVFDPTVYANTNFESLKTFTQITGVELLSMDDSEIDATSYTYFIAENAEEKVYQYQEYLRGIGFVMAYDGYFKLENVGGVSISTKDAENGKNVVIELPCDSKTAQTRKENIYKKLEDHFNKKEYSEVLKIDSSFGTDFNGYKDYEYYFDYSMGIVSWEAGVWGYAYTYFSECSDRADVDAYLKEISKYTGQYRCHVTGGVLDGTDNYIFIDNGDVAMETDSNYSADFMKLAGIDPNDKYDIYYNYPDPVTLKPYNLVVTTNDDGSVKMTIAFVSFENDGTFEIDNRYEFIDNKNGTYEMKELDSKFNKVFEGVYTKISDLPSPGV